MVSARSRTRSRVQRRRVQQQRPGRDRRKSPSRMSSEDCSRSRSRSVSPSRSSRSVSSSPDTHWSRFDRVESPRYWRQRGRSPITLRELTSLTDEENAEGSRILVTGLNNIVTEKDLKKKFSGFARVLEVIILKPDKNGEPRGLAMLTLDREGNVDAAIKAVDQTQWNGRIVLVQKLS